MTVDAVKNIEDLAAFVAESPGSYLSPPPGALDVQGKQQILELLADLQKQHGLSLIIISHDLAVIRAISHRVIVLKDGKIVEDGECENVFANPSSDYTRHLIAHSGHMIQ